MSYFYDLDFRIQVVTGSEISARGVGTVKNPDDIYVEYRGKMHSFEFGRKYYRSLLGVDTIEATLEPASGRAFLPVSGRVKHFTVLYF